MTAVTIDGSAGEGGGQILRTSLGLSLVTGTPFRIVAIRAGRKKPGLLRQHLAAVRAAAAISQAEVTGAELGSKELAFVPGALRGGSFRFEIGSAGSATLVLQTVLPALLRAPAPSELEIEGGTHNSASPPFPFLRDAFAPLLRRIGGSLDLELLRPGFYPAGGGRIRARIAPARALAPLVLEERGAIVERRVRAVLARVPERAGQVAIATLAGALGWTGVDARAEVVRSQGPGHVLCVTVVAEHVTEVMSGFVERGARAEDVARATAAEVRAWLDAGVPVGEHLADQLILPMALGGGGAFRTVAPSLHLRTQIDTVGRFLARRIGLTEEPSGRWRVDVAPA